MKYSAVTLLRKFLFNIDEFWEGNRRQAEKSRKRLDAITNFYSHDRDQCLGFLSRIADERLNSNRRTLYLPSFGASGSHLVQHIVATSTNAITLGEVYMPPMAERHALELDGQERVKFMEMYHLASTSTPWMIPSRGTIVNTAHKAKLQFFSENTAKFSSVLIMRDPCDIAISRTYRKGEYRSYLGKDSISDDDYLSENIALVEKFYRTALSYPFDGYIWFEDLFANNEGRDRIARTLARAIGQLDLFELIRDRIGPALESGGKTNKYDGERVVIEASIIDHVADRLTQIKQKMREVSLP